MRRRSSIALHALALALSSFACGGSGPPPSAPSDKLGQVIAFSLPPDEEALVTVPLPEARATVLDFFGPTCEPCKESVPALHGKRAELAQKGRSSSSSACSPTVRRPRTPSARSRRGA